jgi:hypothetical protein
VSRLAWIGCLAFAAASCARAHAQDQLPLELSWDAPAECPDAASVRAQLERVARVRPGFTLTPLTARAAVVRDGARYALHLHTEHDGRQGERRLQADDCDALASSVTLVLALAFGAGVEVSEVSSPAAAAPRGTADSERPPSAEALAPSEAEPNTEDAASSAARDRDGHASTDPATDAAERAPNGGFALALLLGGGAQLALMPGPALAASAGVELHSGSFSIGLRATGWPAVADTVAAGVQARFDGVAGALAGCGHAPLQAFSFALCASARAAALRGRSSGALEGGSETAPWYAVGVLASLTWPRTSALRVRVESGLALSLDRARFAIEGLGDVHRVPLLAPELALLLMLTP